MSDPRIVPRRLHAIVSHECLVALRPVFRAALVLLFDCRRQMVGAMLLWHSANLPQGMFNPLGQSLKTFTKADTNGFHVRVGENQMEHHMRKGFASNAHLQILHVRKIRLGALCGLVLLWKDDFLFGSMHGSPFGNMPLQGADLCGPIAVWMSLAQQSKQRRSEAPLEHV